MITIKNNYFKIDTENTTYLFKKNPIGTLESIYYGKRIPNEESYSFLEEKILYGGGVEQKEDNYRIYNDCASFEVSNSNRGDYRESFIDIEVEGDHECEFLVTNFEIINNFKVPELPNALNKEETLVITLKDTPKNLQLKLYYSTFKNSDVIVRSASLTNNSDKDIRINRLMSSQTDLIDNEYLATTLDGAWAKERNIHTNPVGMGITVIDSKYGFTSSQTNPYIVLKEKNTTYESGNCYGINIIYSGSHKTIIERTNYHKVRFMNGLNDATFAWILNPKETFFTPESTICFSSEGTNKLTNNYHRFIKDNILRGKYKNQVRPILINNWEATYFDFTEEKLLAIARRAKELGLETFVLDDGWFGKRNSDKTSLGDWYANLDKLPDGLDGLCKKINAIGLDFGIWVEPEMISVDSDVYRAHPDWAISHPKYKSLEQRNQLVMDLTNPDVVDYLIDILSKVFSSGVKYVKWDCNRTISDYYSPRLKEQREFLHRYMLSFYRLIDTLTQRFPDILFESCSMGGNRVDMGILQYMPQFWCSDNSDAYDRMKIQEGTLSCYPQCTIGAHVSDSPNHQTIRKSYIDNRFNVACLGAFGYELDLSKLSLIDTKAVKEQIKWYKEHRETLQYGDFYQISSIFDSNKEEYVIVGKNKSEAIYFIGKGVNELYPNICFAKPTHLDPDFTYKFENRIQYFDFLENETFFKHENPVYKDTYTSEELDNVSPKTSERLSTNVKGETLMNSGVRLDYEWIGGNGPDKRIMLDFGTRIYTIKKI